MILLKTIRDSDIFPDQTDSEKTPARQREAARAVVFDEENKVALLYVSKHDYHKLPGGGLEAGEDISKALEREIIEEIGCKAEVTGEIGEIVEYRNKHNLEQVNHIYSAKLIGEKGEPSFTKEEIADGFQIKWLALSEAIEAIQNDETDDYQGKFIKIRDLTALKTLKEKYV